MTKKTMVIRFCPCIDARHGKVIACRTIVMGLNMEKLNDDNLKLETEHKFNDYVTSFKLSDLV